jgi:hypothetical protein
MSHARLHEWVRLPLAVPVRVRSQGKEFLAYRDAEGVWRHFLGQQVVEGEICLSPFTSDLAYDTCEPLRL